MTWGNNLKALAARFACCLGADHAAMACAQLWALCSLLRGRLEGG
jgi:hypothetical protein